MKIDYIHTMDWDFTDVDVINCNNIKEFQNKIEENKVIEVKKENVIYGVNPNYIIYWEQKEDINA